VPKSSKKISYIKKPFARRSLVCLPAAVTALLLAAVSLGLSIRHAGQGELNVAAWGFSSLLFAAAGLYYGLTSFLEKEMNFLLAKIGVGISGVLLLFWICMTIVGLVG